MLALAAPELGHVSVHLIQTDHGGITVELAASEPATLRLLLQDQAALHQALTQAGLPEAGRSLSFHLAETVPTQAAGQAGSFAASMSSGGQGQGHSQRSSAQASFGDFGAFSQGSRGHGGSTNDAAAERQRNLPSVSRAASAKSPKSTAARSAASRRLRAWVDITA